MSTRHPWVRLLSCNPAEVKDPLVAPFSSGYPAADRSALARVPRGGGADPPRDVGRLRRLLPRCRRRRPVVDGHRARLHARVARSSTLYSYPAEADYARSTPSGPTWHQLDSTVRAADATWALPDHLAGPRRGADLPQPREPRVGGRRPHAAAGGPPGAHVAPGHRVQGPAGGPDHAPRQHDRRGVPAPARDPAAGGPRDHPRRQQHRRRVVPPRQADDRAAAVLGPGRQRPARGRDGVRDAGSRPTTSRTRSCSARSTGCSPTRRCGRGSRAVSARSRRPGARSAPPTSSSGSR